MRKVCYHVAVTLDGFIAHTDGSIGGFPAEGDHVDDYMKALEDYDTVIMGRKTYEFGYAFGLEPGHRAYLHMKHWIFSKSIDVVPQDGVHLVRDHWLETIEEIQKTDGSDIYLCGGSVFAGWLLSLGKIDTLKLKLNPVLFGSGLPLFSNSNVDTTNFELVRSKPYQSGVVLLDYRKRVE
ncbi:MAG: dihydrofolate reductase [Acidimicrobiales bacterium]|nr:dihydrofolate reductase [Hyphomonadaceae bacterium]RZV43465.1 MAG: dihydrofolate reductase [Acidimicrobiales bacterium]